MRNPFQASSEKLPPSDQHDEIVRTVDARCAQLREKCWKMRDIVKHYGDVRREYETSVADGHPGDLDEVMVAFLVNIQSNPNKHPTGQRNDEAQ